MTAAAFARAKIPYRRFPAGSKSSWSARNRRNTALSGNLYSYGVKAHCIKDGVAIDICCGSGNFLLSVYEYAINYCLEWYMKNDRDGAIHNGLIYEVSGGDICKLSYDLRREILIRNIWGVDIDPLAVEVAKFSLFLKLLEETSSEEIDGYIKRTGNRIMPKLEGNIKNGNSLVDMSYTQFDPHIYEEQAKLEKIKMFDLNAEFGRGGFDAIVGNPPYIRVQNMVKYSPEEYAFYKSKYSGYETAQSDLLDKYLLFIERAWNLLGKDGVMGYIIPHKFMNIKSGDALRRFITKRKALRKIIHLGTHQTFKDRSTYTCILELAKNKQITYDIAFVQDWNRFLFEHNVVFETYDLSTLGEEPWTFIPKQITDRLGETEAGCRTLETFSDIFVGVQTSADKIYIVYADHEDDKYIYFVDKNNKLRKIEKGILRKSIYDAKLSKYERIIANSYIIFPYENDNGKPRLIKIDVMRKKYPETLSYLSDFREELDKRNMPKRTDETWYAYGRSQSLRRFVSGEHLIWPVLSLDSNYVYDDEMVVFTGGGNGPFYGIEMKKGMRESIFYIQAILNHWLMELLVKQSASTFRGGYYSHGKQFIAKLPIYDIDWNDSGDIKKHDAIVDKVHIIEDLTERMNSARNSSVRDTMRRSVFAAREELEALIDELYGVEGLRMEISDESD